MNKNNHQSQKNTYLPYFLLSLAAGMLTGGLIFLFKLTAAQVVSLSEMLYALVRSQPIYLVLLLPGAALIGLLAAFILRFEPDCRGGGIPTAIALLRGLITFRWLRSLLCLFSSAMLTYLGGVPLGNEGPSVQMGTAVGCGTSRLFAKQNRAFDRYLMTGGACAGFAAATGAPLTGMFFAFEEAHRRFSPMIFMGSAMSVIAGTAVMHGLCALTDTPFAVFELTSPATLPLRHLWAAIVLGLIAGLAAVGFTRLYRLTRQVIQTRLSRIPFTLRIVLIFVAVALVGFLSSDSIGSGHHLTQHLLEKADIWYRLLFILAVRVLLLVAANNSDVTGGLFVPTLAFGAGIGSLCASALIALGLLPASCYPIFVVIGSSAFLGACSHTPLMAITFAIEALCGLSNSLPVIVGVAFAYLVVEFSSPLPFTDTVIEGKTERANRNKVSQIVETYMTVMPGAFIIGKEIRDLLLPPTCTVLLVQKADTTLRSEGGIGVGDRLFLRYQTFDPDRTLEELEAIVGKQKAAPETQIYKNETNEEVPDV